ncbi:hypothetical protein RKD26_000166 [Streptomyces calvus]|uniref:hypothetical protein n=1 Tax=Streptomyces calvus TaxID=67282 RepID=UPI003512E4EF
MFLAGRVIVMAARTGRVRDVIDSTPSSNAPRSSVPVPGSPHRATARGTPPPPARPRRRPFPAHRHTGTRRTAADHGFDGPALPGRHNTVDHPDCPPEGARPPHFMLRPVGTPPTRAFRRPGSRERSTSGQIRLPGGTFAVGDA